jgi:hypothetical protein
VFFSLAEHVSVNVANCERGVDLDEPAIPQNMIFGIFRGFFTNF